MIETAKRIKGVLIIQTIIIILISIVYRYTIWSRYCEPIEKKALNITAEEYQEMKAEYESQNK